MTKALDLMRRASGKQGPASLEAFVDANKAEALAPRKERAKPRRIEAGILREVLELVRIHPKCAFAYRQNAGTFGENYTRLGPRGICDIIGMMKDGRYLAIEIKAPGKRPEEHQFAFMKMVSTNGGVAGWCTSIEEAKAILDAHTSDDGIIRPLP